MTDRRRRRVTGEEENGHGRGTGEGGKRARAEDGEGRGGRGSGSDLGGRGLQGHLATVNEAGMRAGSGDEGYVAGWRTKGDESRFRGRRPCFRVES